MSQEVAEIFSYTLNVNQALSVTKNREVIIDFSKLSPAIDFSQSITSAIQQNINYDKYSNKITAYMWFYPRDFTFVNFNPNIQKSILYSHLCSNIEVLRILSNSLSFEDFKMLFPNFSSVKSLTLSMGNFMELNGRTLEFSFLEKLKEIHFLNASIQSKFSIEFQSSASEQPLQFISFHGDAIRQELKSFQFFRKYPMDCSNSQVQIDLIVFAQIPQFKKTLKSFPNIDILNDPYCKHSHPNDMILFIHCLPGHFNPESSTININISEVLNDLTSSSKYNCYLVQNKKLIYFSAVGNPNIDFTTTNCFKDVSSLKGVNFLPPENYSSSAENPHSFRYFENPIVLEHLEISLSTFLQMRKHFNGNNNLQFLRVYGCHSQDKITELFEKLYRFPNLRTLYIEDSNFTSKLTREADKYALSELKVLCLARISFKNLQFFLSNARFRELIHLKVELYEPVRSKSLYSKMHGKIQRLISKNSHNTFEKLIDFELKCEKLPKNFSDLLSKMPKLERLCIEMNYFNDIKVFSNLSKESVLLEDEKVSVEILDFYLMLLNANQNLKTIKINNISLHREEIQILNSIWAQFNQYDTKKYPKTFQLSLDCFLFGMLKHDTKLQYLAEQNPSKIGAYIFSKLNIDAYNTSDDEYLLLWSFSFKNFSELYPVGDEIFNWPLFSEIIVFLYSVGSTQIKIESIDEFSLYTKSILPSDSDIPNPISHYFHSNQNSISLKNIDSVSFLKSLIKNIAETMNLDKKISIEPIVHLNFSFQRHLYLTDGNLIQLITILLKVFFYLHSKYFPQSDLNISKYFDTFELFFGSDFFSPCQGHCRQQTVRMG